MKCELKNEFLIFSDLYNMPIEDIKNFIKREAFTLQPFGVKRPLSTITNWGFFVNDAYKLLYKFQKAAYNIKINSDEPLTEDCIIVNFTDEDLNKNNINLTLKSTINLNIIDLNLTVQDIKNVGYNYQDKNGILSDKLNIIFALRKGQSLAQEFEFNNLDRYSDESYLTLEKIENLYLMSKIDNGCLIIRPSMQILNLKDILCKLKCDF